MAGVGTEKCPWSILGIPRTASENAVRDAYRKQALKWHPDLNKSSPDAQTRFHEIKDAFEEIKRRQFQSTARRPHVTRRNETSYGHYRNRYTHADTNRDRTGSNFSSFRRDRTQSEFRGGYQDESFRQRPPRGTTHESLRAIRSRLRAVESVGFGFGILMTVTVLTSAALAGDVAWKNMNRGKSFDEMMRNLDENPTQKQEMCRKRRRKPIEAKSNQGVESSEDSTRQE